MTGTAVCQSFTRNAAFDACGNLILRTVIRFRRLGHHLYVMN